MRLMIQEYLSMLKESDELDIIVPNLLNSMNIDVVAGAQKGVRQDGVDIHGIGIDPDTGEKTNFLITIKKGDITRNIWSSDKQSVRQSLEEIIDIYMSQKMTKEQKELPSKIILCYGGEMKQEVQPNWTGFTTKYTDHTFDNWGGSKLSGLIEKHLTDENLFFEDVKQDMRRTIVFLSDCDYQLTHFKEMLKKLFLDESWDSKSSSKLEKDAIKAINMVSLCLGMINQYSVESENEKHVIKASELSMLNTWSFVLKNKLDENKKIVQKYHELHAQNSWYSANYFKKLEKYYFVKDGICKQGRDSISSSVITFEQIGILSCLGLNNIMYALATKDDQTKKNAEIVSEALCALIQNNTISSSPCFDGQTIDICLALYLMVLTNKVEEAKKWIDEITHRFRFSYNVYKKGFPIAYDSLDILIEFEFGEEHTKEKMAGMSTLIPNLAYWCAILDFEDEYKQILSLVEDLKETTLQMWFPAVGVKEHFFIRYSANKAGIAEAPIFLPEKLSELKDRIKEFLVFSNESKDIETVWNDAPPGLALVASRQFRTPVIPFFWLNFVNADVKAEELN